MNNKKTYTREEKIEYYLKKIERTKARVTLLLATLEKLEARVEFIRGPDYQDWNSDLEQDLKRAKHYSPGFGDIPDNK